MLPYLLDDGVFDVDIFEHGLDDHVDVLKVLVRDGTIQLRQHRVLLKPEDNQGKICA